MAKESVEKLGQKIKRLRKEKGMSQTELADGFVTNSMISQIENDKNTPSIELLQHLARKLQVPLQELVKNELEQMESLNQHKLAKVYLESYQPDHAEPLLHHLLNRSDLPQTESIDLTIDLAKCKYQQKKYNECQKLLVPLITQLEKVNYDDAYTLALIHHTLGNAFYLRQLFTDAKYHYQRAFDLTNRFPNFDSLAAKISYNLGITLRMIGQRHDSASYLERSYDYFKENNDFARLATTIYEQGITYKNMQDYTRAAECFVEAKGIFRALDLKENSFIVQHTMASTVTVQTDPLLALEQLQECLVSFQEEKNFVRAIHCYSRMSAIHLQMNNDESAYTTLTQAISLLKAHSLQDAHVAGECYQMFADYYNAHKEYKNAIEYAMKAFHLYDRIGLMIEQVDSLQIVADTYHAMEDFEHAYLYQKKCDLLLRQLNGRREDIL